MSRIVNSKYNIPQLNYPQRNSILGSSSGFSWTGLIYPEAPFLNSNIDIAVTDYKTPVTGDVIKFDNTISRITNVLSSEVGSDFRVVQATVNIADSLGPFTFPITGIRSSVQTWTGTLFLTTPSQTDSIYIEVPQTSTNPENGDTIVVNREERVISNVMTLSLVTSPKQFLLTINNPVPEKVIKVTGKGTGKKFSTLGICLRSVESYNVVTYGNPFVNGETVRYTYYLNENTGNSLIPVHGTTTIQILSVGEQLSVMNLPGITSPYLTIHKPSFGGGLASVKYFRERRRP